jgi:hypothetical protein
MENENLKFTHVVKENWEYILFSLKKTPCAE